MANYQCNGWHITEESPYFPLPSTASSKQSLVNQFINKFKEVRASRYSVNGFRWAKYFTGNDAGCGELLVISRAYARMIGYGGPITFKNDDFLIANAKYFHYTPNYPSTDSDLKVLPQYKVKGTSRKN